MTCMLHAQCFKKTGKFAAYLNIRCTYSDKETVAVLKLAWNKLKCHISSCFFTSVRCQWSCFHYIIFWQIGLLAHHWKISNGKDLWNDSSILHFLLFSFWKIANITTSLVCQPHGFAAVFCYDFWADFLLLGLMATCLMPFKFAAIDTVQIFPSLCDWMIHSYRSCPFFQDNS